jgi:tetratricopeptide (TPR) repeat protein
VFEAIREEGSSVKKILVSGALALLFLSCQSLGKDLQMEIMDAARRGELAELEEMITALDRPSAGSREGIRAARSRIAELEKKPSADTEYSAALAAWSGRVYLLEAKNSEALRELKKSQSLSPGNTQSLVLALRLEEDPQKRLARIDQELRIAGPSAGEVLSPGDTVSPGAALQLERARTLLELRRYREAAGAFDTALSGSLPQVYRDTYAESRALAWELRDAPPETEGKIVDLMGEALSWTSVIELAKTETDLLRFLSAGRDLPSAELFTRLLDRSFIPSTQDITRSEWSADKARMEEQVLRSGAAWFLWRLYAENRADRGLLSKYSSRYSSLPNPRSPIADLPLLSPFFDAILGCVETELMSLPDGRNFYPAEALRGAEFAAMLKKVKTP